MDERDRILPSREQQDGALELAGGFAKDKDRFGLELLEMRAPVMPHGACCRGRLVPECGQPPLVFCALGLIDRLPQIGVASPPVLRHTSNVLSGDRRRGRGQKNLDPFHERRRVFRKILITKFHALAWVRTAERPAGLCERSPY